MSFKNRKQQAAVMAKIGRWRKVVDNKYALSYSDSSVDMQRGDKFKFLTIIKPERRYGRKPATSGVVEIEEKEVTGKYGEYNSSRPRTILRKSIKTLDEGKEIINKYMRRHQ